MRISQHNLLLALECLAARYQADAQETASVPSIAETFQRQAKEIDGLRAKIEAYDDDAPLMLEVDGF